MPKIHHRTALITGGALRVGEAICRRLHAEGFQVAVHYRSSADAAKQLAAELNQQRANSAITLQADLNDAQALQLMCEQLSQQWGQLDALINNASTFYPTPIGDCRSEDWDALINSNVKGAFFLSQHLRPLLQKAKGSIVNLLDIHAETPLKQHSIYCMAKAAAAMMTKSLALELAPDIRVNGISPGAILWPESQQSLDQDALQSQQQSILQQVPLRKIGNPVDIASSVKFLVCDAPYVTGQILAVDGGRSVCR